MLEEDGEEEGDDAAAAVPDVCVEFPCQLNSMLKTSTADSIEADTTRDCSVVFLIVSFYCYFKYYKIVLNTICGTQKLEFYMYIKKTKCKSAGTYEENGHCCSNVY
jgi:hypothetical protein